MWIKAPDRRQRFLLPPSIDDFVAADHRVRVIVEIVDRLDLSRFKTGEHEVGRSAYPPATMISVLLYSFSIGVFSSREIARRCRTDCVYMFASASLKPSYRTLARFRSDNEEAISDVYVQVVKVCVTAGLGDRSILAVDGSTIRASASTVRHLKRSHLSRELDKARQKMSEMLRTAAELDAQESGLPDDDVLPVAFQKAQKRVAAIEEALKELDAIGEDELNKTDPDATMQRFRQGGSAPGYRVEIGVNADGVIIASDVVNDQADTAQLVPIVDQARQNTGARADVVVADAGYSSGENFKQLVERDQDAVVAAGGENSLARKREKSGLFQRDDFRYDASTDSFECPAGRRLILYSTAGENHRMYQGRDCADCPLRNQCTRRAARRITVTNTSPYFEAMADRREHDRRNGKLLARRGSLVEHHFGHFKHNLRWKMFLRRGLEACRSEFRLLCAAFNIGKLHAAVAATGG